MDSNEKIPLIENVKLLYSTQCSYSLNWLSIPHTHPFTELFYVTKGSGEFQIKDQFFDIHEHDLILVNPYITHTERSKNKKLEYIVLGIENFIFFDTSNEENQDYLICNYECYKNEILFYIKNILAENSVKDEFSEISSQYLLKILLMNLLRRTSANIQLTSDLDVSKECHTVKKYIQKHFKENITLDTLSDLVFLNKYYLAHAFKKYNHISPINYQLKLRIEEAKLLLKTTNLVISDVSNSLGFSSQSYFSQIFKRHTGLTPNQYRKNNNKAK